MGAHARKLDVLAAYYNPAGFRARRANYAAFAAHMQSFPAVRLVTVECAFGDSPFELEAGAGVIQVRAEHPIWISENLYNIGLSRTDSPYVAWIDCDLLFQNPHWAEQTIEALQTYHVIQPWSTVYCLDSDGRKMDEGMGAFCRIHQHGEFDCKGICHAGYAWAIRRQVLEAAGGLLEDLVLGGADELMSRAIFDADRRSFPTVITGPYRACVDAWCRRFSAAVQRSVGYNDGDIHHLFHGHLADRQYFPRHFIPQSHGFDPAIHLRRNADGVVQLIDQPAMCDRIRTYFEARQEDSVCTSAAS